MTDSSIGYKSIIMRCDRIDKSAYLALDSDVKIDFYKKGMETVWAKIQKLPENLKKLLRRMS